MKTKKARSAPKGTGKRAEKVAKEGDKKRQSKKRPSTEKRTPDSEIVIKSLGRSILVEEDLQKLERKAKLSEMEKHKKRMPRLFYRNFVYRCEKCISEFEHKTIVPIVEHEVVCPECGEVHIIKIVPVSRHYELRLPKGLRIIDVSEKE